MTRNLNGMFKIVALSLTRPLKSTAVVARSLAVFCYVEKVGDSCHIQERPPHKSSFFFGPSIKHPPHMSACGLLLFSKFNVHLRKQLLYLSVSASL